MIWKIEIIIQFNKLPTRSLYAKGVYETKQNINFYLRNEKVQAYSILMILELFLNTQIIPITFTKN